MSQQPHTTRRRLLTVTGTLAVAGLAGCSESSGEAGGENSTPTETDEGTPTPEDNHDDAEDGHSDEEDSHGDEEDNHEEDSHGDHDHENELPDGPSPTATVRMQTSDSGQHFSPHVVWVETGGTVTWELESGIHNAVAYHSDNDKPLRMPEGGDSWSGELLDSEGETFEHTFETEGVYDYYCAPHEGVGMLGSVIVGQPDAHGQPALEEPQDSMPEGARTELSNLNDKVNQALGHTH